VRMPCRCSEGLFSEGLFSEAFFGEGFFGEGFFGEGFFGEGMAGQKRLRSFLSPVVTVKRTGVSHCVSSFHALPG
jgi:hypothetical protein